MPRSELNPCVGYVYTGQFLLRAKVAKDLVMSANGLTHIEGEVGLFPWYTYRRIENAISRLQQQKVLAGDANLNIVAYTPELQAELKKDSIAAARLTRDHILHMLTAGKNVQPADLPAYEQKADAFLERMEKANAKTKEAAA